MENIYFLIISYLIGSISFAYFTGKIFFKLDIREHGSKNLGATNSFRVLGKKAGIFVMLGDVFKGFLVCYVAKKLELEWNVIIFGVAAILGHCYSIFVNFKGGKAVATTGGVLLFIDPAIFLVFLVSALLVLFSFKIVSLASMVGATIAAITSLIISEQEIAIMMVAVALFIIFKHKENIKRIIKKEEPKIGKKNK